MEKVIRSILALRQIRRKKIGLSLDYLLTDHVEVISFQIPSLSDAQIQIKIIRL